MMGDYNYFFATGVLYHLHTPRVKFSKIVERKVTIINLNIFYYKSSIA